MNSKQLIESNFELREQLNEENKKYYDRLLIYIRANLSKDTQITEETLYEVLQHLIEVQRDGKLAADVFGANPKQMADEIIEQLPEVSKKSKWLYGIELFLILVGVYVAVQGIPDLFSKSPIIVYVGSSILTVLALVTGLVVIMYTVLKMFEKEASSEKEFKWKNGLVFGIVFGGVTVGIGVFNVMMKPFGPTVSVPNYVPILVGVLFVVISIVMGKFRK